MANLNLKVNSSSVFQYCPKVEGMCGFCAESDWNPITETKGDKKYLFCGMVTGYDTRVEPLPNCWLKMSNKEKANYRKRKKEEYLAFNPDKIQRPKITYK